MLDLRERSRAGLMAGVGLAVLLLAPLLGSGYVLVQDMVFVPRTPLGSQLLGLDGVPRGVPSELLVALASRVIAAGWLQDLLLVAITIGGAWGAARLAPTTSRAGAMAAATTYGWSPYLHERLLLGQWALLVGWAVLPWAVRAALDWRQGGTGWWPMAALSVAALAGANALLLVALAVVVCGRPLKALVATAILSLPWAVPGLLQHVAAGDPRGVAGFAAHADGPLGVLVSLLTGGGVWSEHSVPPGRSAGLAIAVALLVVAAAGLPRVRARVGDRLLVLAGAGLLLSLLAHLPLLGDLLRWAVVHVPSAGLLRDGQKWIAPLVLLTSAGVACGAEVVLSRIAETPVRRTAAALFVLAPLAALPGASWGEGGRLTSSRWPADWERVTRQAHGAVLVLPWTLYRAFPWEGDETVLDPATKLLERPVVNDDLPLRDAAVHGEDPLAARLNTSVTSGMPLLGALRAAGIDQVLVERTTRGNDPARTQRQTDGLAQVRQTRELALYDVPGTRRRLVPSRRRLALVGDALAACFVALSLTKAVRARRTWLPLP